MRNTVLIILLFHSTFAFHSCNIFKKKNPPRLIVVEEIEEIKVVEEESFSIDTLQTSLANFVSGIEKSYYDSIIFIDSAFWNEFTDKVNKDFSKIQSSRLTKMLEWIDTLFLVIRKRKVGFLHWFHHIITYTYCWYASLYSYSADATGIWFAGINLFIHYIITIST